MRSTSSTAKTQKKMWSNVRNTESATLAEYGLPSIAAPASCPKNSPCATMTKALATMSAPQDRSNF
eukprot:CAMPEP_0203878480 /NCGR_PEP_ID=MMETSP0359-20131031/23032_1 /ASSEMBLY_ACC=CAM_ASM_000338 /TAXON_ID=268821 /ORGANISM="Scrippsiella Hangoei, Strain SHTV-5" /LENGTH=65 /DNA_ID=CAMNT_0050797677 /DNA_START=25 /DNA_END=222 /DNA_ORIENTATION=+